MNNSEARLWRLIEERAASGADTAAIDESIWRTFGEDWAVVFTDLAGFSRKTEQFGIIHFLQVIHAMRELLYPVIERHRGFLVKAEADSLLLLFRSADDALRCSIAMQRACQQANERLVPEEQILLCLGIGAGPILRVGNHECWGSQVNAASKLGEDTAKTDEILITDAAREALTAGEFQVDFAELDARIPGSGKNFRVRYR